MTRITGLGRHHMRRAHSRRNHVIVTTDTGPVDLRMINCCGRCPARSCVTGITLIAGVNMGCRILASGNGPIMTALAGAAGFVVIHRRYRRPGRIDMTRLTQVGGIHMGLRILAANKRVIVATNTGSCRCTVIKAGDIPVIRGVADVAGLCRRNVRDRILTRRDHSIMTTFTGTNHLGMINGNNRYPGG